MLLLFTLICSLVVINMSNIVSYNQNAALTAVYYSFGAYCDADCLQSWDCSTFCTKRPHFAVDSVVISKKYSLQAFTGYDPQTQQIVISFRGTKNNENLLIDIDWGQMYFKEGEAYNTGKGRWAIHQGFYWGLYELCENGLSASLRELLTEHKEANVLITGHSLGGALAQMLALMFATVPIFNSLSFGEIEIITFGAPRWGSKDIITYFNTLPYTNWRVVNKYDMIPTLPWESMGDYGYYHAKSEVQYTDWDTLKHQLCDGDGEKSSNCAYVASWNKKYHLYYLNVFENGCGLHEPKDEWFSQHIDTNTTIATIDRTHSSVDVSSDMTLTIQYVSTQDRDEDQTKKQHSDWMMVAFVSVGAFACLLVIFCVLFGVKLYHKSKRNDDDDGYVTITDNYAI